MLTKAYMSTFLCYFDLHILIVTGTHNLVTNALNLMLPVRTVLADLLIREDSLKSILKYLVSSYFLLEM